MGRVNDIAVNDSVHTTKVIIKRITRPTRENK